jgi:hypothetical protein
VEDAVVRPFAAWESFYVIVGSSGAALTGLQFVVIALGAEGRKLGNMRAIDAFGTPTIVHFCAALLLAAVLCAPWPTLSSAALVLGFCGVAGIVYMGIVTRRARRLIEYRPVFEDWLWHTALPFIAYATLLASAALLVRYLSGALFAIAVAALLLLFIGIHNAWDTVTYFAIERMGQKQENVPD